MDNILVSVIIPVYNSECYLRQCLDSVINQTLSDIEIICVDDGSTDYSPSILLEYQNKDKRVSIITKKNENAGAGPARNAGLDKAKGRYLLFLDSDDYFDLHMFEKITANAEETNADIVLFDAYEYDNRSGKLTEFSEVLNKRYLPEKPCFNRNDISDTIFQITTGAAWCMLFRRDFIINLGVKFQPVHHADDLFFTFRSLVNARRVSILDQRLLYYRIHNPKSQTEQKSSWPEAEFTANMALKTALIHDGIFPDVERSFVNMAVKYNRWYLDTMNTWEGYLTLYNNLKSSYFDKLGISNREAAYFYDESNYIWYKNIIVNEPEKSIFSQLQYIRSMGLQVIKYDFPKELVKPSTRLVIYGAGDVGLSYFVQALCSRCCKIIAWVDKRANEIGFPIEMPQKLLQLEYDKVLIAIVNETVAAQIKTSLINMGLLEDTIIWVRPEY